MYQLIFVEEAKIELKNEIRYSSKQWGKTHARKYSAELKKLIFNLKTNPLLYPLHNDILPGIRILTYKGNRVVYILQEKKHRVVVLAVLSIYQPIDKNTLQQRVENL